MIKFVRILSNLTISDSKEPQKQPGPSITIWLKTNKSYETNRKEPNETQTKDDDQKVPNDQNNQKRANLIQNDQI